MECLLPYLCMVTVPHIMVGLERMLNYRFHCNTMCIHFLEINMHIHMFLQYIRTYVHTVHTYSTYR